MTARPSGSTSTAAGHRASRARTRAPSRRSPHTSGSAGLHREITALGYAGSYSAFTRELRGHGISAACRTCKPWQPVTPARQQRPPLLPVRVAPLAGEAISSYLSRVAAASHLPVTAITDVLPPWFSARAAACDDLAAAGLLQPGDAGHLASLTGVTETALRHALPALAGTRDDGRPPVRAAIACRRCAARAGHRERVPAHLPAHQRAAGGTAPGSAAPPRSTSPPPRTSSGPAATPPGLPASTASPGSCSPRRSRASRPPPWPAARMPAGLRCSLPPIPAWTRGTRTSPKQRPTPRRSRRLPQFSARPAGHPPGRNDWQNLAPAQGGPTSMTRRRPLSCHLKRPAQVRATPPGRYVCHRTVDGQLGSGDSPVLLRSRRSASPPGCWPTLKIPMKAAFRGPMWGC